MFVSRPQCLTLLLVMVAAGEGCRDQRASGIRVAVKNESRHDVQDLRVVLNQQTRQVTDLRPGGSVAIVFAGIPHDEASFEVSGTVAGGGQFSATGGYADSS